MSDLLDIIKKEKKLCYLLGDYNINLFNVETHGKTSEFIELIFANHFVPLINKPTRVRANSATLIDNIYTNHITAESTQGIFYTDISDHFPIFYGCPSFSTDTSPQYITKRVYSDTNVNRFVILLETCDWNNVYESGDPQRAYSFFHKKFHDAYMQSFFMKTFKIKYHNRKPWLSKGLKDCINKKNKLYIKYKRYPTSNMEIIYKKYKNILKVFCIKLNVHILINCLTHTKAI